MSNRDYTAFKTALPHPGAHLREDFLPEYGLSPGALAKAMRLKDRTRVERLIRERQPVRPDTALRLAKVFGTTAEFWMNLQAQYDLSVAAISARDEIKAIHPVNPLCDSAAGTEHGLTASAAYAIFREAI